MIVVVIMTATAEIVGATKDMLGRKPQRTDKKKTQYTSLSSFSQSIVNENTDPSHPCVENNYPLKKDNRLSTNPSDARYRGSESQRDTLEGSDEWPLCLAPGLAMKAHSDSVCFGAVVNETLLEPGMLQGLLGSDPLLRVVDEDLLKEVQEGTIERSINWDELLRVSKTVRSSSGDRIM